VSTAALGWADRFYLLTVLLTGGRQAPHGYTCVYREVEASQTAT
jgi:hypothetical protein